MSWFGTNPMDSALYATGTASNGTASVAQTGYRTGLQVTGARRARRGQGVGGTRLLDRARGGRRGELPMTPSAGRQTARTQRFATERAAGESRRRGAAPSPSRPGVVIIASPSDLLAQLVATSLVYAHIPTCQLEPGDLKDVELERRGRTATLNGNHIGGILWRTLCPGSTCADPTITASWLAVASFASMRAVNAYDPDAWCRGAGWSVWGDRLADGGVPVDTSEEPHPVAATSLMVCGHIVAGPATATIRAAADTLEASGVHLATVTSLPDGRVTDVDAQPDVSDSLHARRAAACIADYLAA